MEWDKREAIPTPTRLIRGCNSQDTSDSRHITNSRSTSSSSPYNQRNSSGAVLTADQTTNNNKYTAHRPVKLVSVPTGPSSTSPQLDISPIPSDSQSTSSPNRVLWSNDKVLSQDRNRIRYFHVDEDVRVDKVDNDGEGELCAGEATPDGLTHSHPVFPSFGTGSLALNPTSGPPFMLRQSSLASALFSLSSASSSSPPSSTTPGSGRILTTLTTPGTPEASPFPPKAIATTAGRVDDNTAMGVLCPTDMKPLDGNNGYGAHAPVSPSLQGLPLEATSQFMEHTTQEGSSSSSSSSHVPRPLIMPSRRMFTFDPHCPPNSISSRVTQASDSASVNRCATSTSPNSANACATNPNPSSANTCATNPNSYRGSEPRTFRYSPNTTGVAPTFRRLLSKRKSESLLDIPRTFSEDSLDLDLEDDADNECFLSARNAFESMYMPKSPKARRMENEDPFQLLRVQVQRKPCLIVTVRVLSGRNITNGFQDCLDTPDPYVKLHMDNSPQGKKVTTTKDNNPNPVWNEEFHFYVNDAKTNILEITLMESNVWPLRNQDKGTCYFNVADIKQGQPRTETFTFNEVSEIDLEFSCQEDPNPTLRYSLCLSDAEKQFQKRRKTKVYNAMRRLLGEDGPKNINEVPTIAVIGSGGGFRALTGYSGVFKALVESEILDCTMYTGGLSGSSWFLSTLYSHPKWPDLDMGEFLDELMNSVDKNLFRFFDPRNIYKNINILINKRRGGQPVSFTDVFGRLVGETLIQGRMDATLSDQRQKLEDSSVPMPLYTCVHVKKDVDAKSFQEWVEFSPYEIGMARYGTFMDTKHFGSKFFMGKLVKKFDEPPLHFLQGIWGSAFCILFKRFLDDNRRMDPVQMIRLEVQKKESHDDVIRKEMEQKLDNPSHESSSDCSDDDDEHDKTEGSLESDTSEPGKPPNSSMESAGSPQSTTDQKMAPAVMDGNCTANEDPAYDGEGEDNDDEEYFSFSYLPDSSVQMKKDKSVAPPKGIICDPRDSQRFNSSDGLKKSVNWRALHTHEANKKDKQEAFARANSRMKKSKTSSMGYWKRMLKGIVESKSWEMFSTRRYRASVIHNFMRGLSLEKSYPLSPFTHENLKEGDDVTNMVSTSHKHIYMVDAGLTFNSPYPIMLRPQREVDIILSFDFTARESDKHEPFKELLLAAKWAEKNIIPFPPIDVSKYINEEVKELYIFKHPTDPYCPVVFHFALVNNKFKYYSKPGVSRQTKEEFDFAEFDIFDDLKAPYSTFSFTYDHQSFKRLSQLTEFNTLLHINEIKQEMKAAVRKKRDLPSRSFKLWQMHTVQKLRKQKHPKPMHHTGDSGSNTPLFTASSTIGSPSTNLFFTGSNREDSLADSSGFSTPQEERDMPDFGRCTQVKSPTKIGWSSSLTGEEKRANFVSCDSVYGTPPEDIDLESNSNSSLQAVTKSSDDGQSPKTLSTKSSSANANSPLKNKHIIGNPYPKCIVASAMRTRKESPPNPFFTNFRKSAPSSPISSPVSSDSTKHFQKRMKEDRHTSSNSTHCSKTKPDDPLTLSSGAALNLSISETKNPSLRSDVCYQNISSASSKTPSGYCSQEINKAEVSSELFRNSTSALKYDGPIVKDSKEVEMNGDRLQFRRKLFRMQSTVSSMNTISLDETTNDEDLETQYLTENGKDEGFVLNLECDDLEMSNVCNDHGNGLTDSTSLCCLSKNKQQDSVDSGVNMTFQTP